MSKISPIQNNYLSNINKVKLEEDKKLKKSEVTSGITDSDSVVTKVKPELDSIEEASFLADKLSFKLQETPSDALSAQGDLNEVRILALLEDDE